MANAAEIMQFRRMPDAEMYGAVVRSLADMDMRMGQEYDAVVISRGIIEVPGHDGPINIAARVFTITPRVINDECLGKIVWVFSCLFQGPNARNIGPFNKNLMLRTLILGNDGEGIEAQEWIRRALVDCHRSIRIRFSLDDRYSSQWRIDLLETGDTPGWCSIL